MMIDVIGRAYESRWRNVHRINARGSEHQHAGWQNYLVSVEEAYMKVRKATCCGARLSMLVAEG